MTKYNRKHDYDAILDRWAAGDLQGQIAAAHGIPTHTVRAIVRAQRLKGDPRAVLRPGARSAEELPDDGRSGWTEERVVHAERLYKDGHSASQIAKAVGGGISRNAVIGVAHRRGWRGQAQPQRRTESTRPKSAKHADRSLANKINAGKVGKPALAPVSYVEPEPVHVPYAGPRYGILDDRLTHFMCRAIVEGSGPTTLFCSAPTVDGPFRFCSDHAAVYLTGVRSQPWSQERRDKHVAMLRKRAGVAA